MSVNAVGSEGLAADPQRWLDTQTDVDRIVRSNGITNNLRIGLLANISRKSRADMANDMSVDRSQPDRRLKRARLKIQMILESNWMQVVSIVLVLIEMMAVIFELLLEVCFLSFEPSLDPKIVEALHYTSVTILSCFQVRVPRGPSPCGWAGGICPLTAYGLQTSVRMRYRLAGATQLFWRL